MVSDEVYEALKRLKRPRESFSDVIKRLISLKRGNLLELVGSKAIAEEGAKLLEEYLRKMRRVDLERLRRMTEDKINVPIRHQLPNRSYKRKA